MGTFHFVVSFSGQTLGSLTAIAPSRPGPRHCGHSWAERVKPQMNQATQIRTPGFFLMAPPVPRTEYHRFVKPSAVDSKPDRQIQFQEGLMPGQVRPIPEGYHTV